MRRPSTNGPSCANAPFSGALVAIECVVCIGDQNGFSFGVVIGDHVKHRASLRADTTSTRRELTHRDSPEQRFLERCAASTRGGRDHHVSEVIQPLCFDEPVKLRAH
jgi:hypothetical protein